MTMLKYFQQRDREYNSNKNTNIEITPVSESWTTPIWWIGSCLYWGRLAPQLASYLWATGHCQASSGWSGHLCCFVAFVNSHLHASLLQMAGCACFPCVCTFLPSNTPPPTAMQAWAFSFILCTDRTTMACLLLFRSSKKERCVTSYSLTMIKLWN